MAKGGSVKYYCDGPRAHEAGCEYFADGGKVEEDEIVQAFHMGPEGIKELDPEMQGKGADARKFLKTGKPQTAVSHAYLPDTKPEDLVLSASGSKKHKLDVNLNKMYDIDKDPKGIIAQAQSDIIHGLIKPEEGAPINAMDLAKTRIKLAGYHGIKRGNFGSVELFHKTPLYAEGGEVKGGAAKSNDKIRQIADQYAKEKGLHLKHDSAVSKVDPERAKQIAAAYEKMEHAPKNSKVKAAYDKLIDETLDQYSHIKNSGLKVSKMEPGMENPYKSSKDLFHDIEHNNHMWFYPTEQGFGSSEASDHPLMIPTSEKIGNHRMLANDVFRVVHDYFGHAKEGNGFGPNGEEKAWQEHKQMYSPEAAKALTSETRGQNSWVNYGPYGEANRKDPANTRFAEQKAGLLPDWVNESSTPAIKMADGGSVGLEEVPDQSAAIPAASPTDLEEVPDQQAAMPDVSSLEEVPDQAAAMPQDETLATAVEGAGRAFVPGMDMLSQGMRHAATAMGVPDEYLHYIAPSKEDLARHQEENQVVSRGAEALGTVASVLTGTGIAGLGAKVANTIAPKVAATALGKIGSVALKAGIESSLIQANDEISNAFLHDINPEDAAIPAMLHIGAAGLLGAASGGLFNKGSQILESMGATKAGTKVSSFLSGIGSGSEGAKVPKAVLGDPNAWFNRLGDMASPEVDRGAYKLGDKWALERLPNLGSQVANGVSNTIGSTVGGAIGNSLGGVKGAVTGSGAGVWIANKTLAPILEKVLGTPIQGVANKTVPWMALKTMAAGDHTGAWKLLNYATQAGKGQMRLTKGIDAVLRSSGPAAYEFLKDPEKDREKLKNYIDSGQYEQEIKNEKRSGEVKQDLPNTDNTFRSDSIGNSTQEITNHNEAQEHKKSTDSHNVPQFAEGGLVDKTSMPESTDNGKGIFAGSDTLARHYPNQNNMLQAAKGQINNHLASIRPNKPGASKLAFDKHMRDEQKEHDYDRVLDLANHPLSILNHIQDGTLDTAHMQHFVSMYPDVYKYLTKKLTEKLTNHQFDEETLPPYHTRQALSLFLGAPLEGSFTPQSIMAAQSAFVPNAPANAPQPQGKAKKGSPSKMTEKGAKAYQTPNQAGEQDATKRD